MINTKQQHNAATGSVLLRISMIFQMAYINIHDQLLRIVIV